MLSVRRLAFLPRCNKEIFSPSSSRLSSSHANSNKSNPSDVDPIPTNPTWSVHALLASYPQPRLTHAELTKLHKLSALVPPEEGSEKAERLKEELEEMVRLVEAVRLVDTSSGSSAGLGQVPEDQTGELGDRNETVGGDESTSAIPDGRIWEAGKGMKLSSNTREVEFDDPEVEHGKALLRHAKVTRDGFYVVEADRRKKK